MIASLSGKLLNKAKDSIIIDVQGVGYRVFLSQESIRQCPQIGENLSLIIYTLVKEDAITLYGFHQNLEEQLFIRLINISGVGPKLALGLLSGLPPKQLTRAIFDEDLSKLVAIPGIGKKSAQRLIVELKDKILELLDPEVSDFTESDSKPVRPQEEAISAFINLGYSRAQAEKALAQIPGAATLGLSDLVKKGLKELAN